MKVRPSALILKDDCILTLRYNYGDKNVFALPGGNPDPGECLSEALARELMEELGVTTEVNSMVLSGEVIWDEVKKETFHIVFEATISSGIAELNPVHTTALEVVWLPLSSVCDTLLYPNVGKFLLQYLKGKPESMHIGVIDQPYIH